MGRTRRHTFAYHWWRITKWVALVVAGLLAFFTQAVPEWWPGFAKSIALWIQGVVPEWLLFACLVYFAVADVITGRLKSPQTWDALHGSLDNLRDYFFRGIEGPLHHHRVTLFEWKVWSWNWRVWSIRKKRWPWSGWLVPIVRSGHTTQRSGTRFFASRTSSEPAEGFAGLVWARNQTLVLNGLPDLHSSPSEDDFERYARAAFATKKWLKQRLRENKRCARSFCGMPVEVNNRIWGVIVIDSDIEKLPDSSELQDIYGLLGQLLGNMLQGR
jgi:hypothetical protein